MNLLRRFGLIRLIAVATVTSVFAFASPAWANTTIFINDGNVPTTAADFAKNPDKLKCDANQGGGPYAGQDVWVFVLPGNHSDSGDFVSLTAQFTGQSDVTITAAGNPSNFSNGGPATSKAWIITPAGWELTGAQAEVTGALDAAEDFFVLSHVCPSSTSSSSPSPSVSASESHDPGTSPSPSVSESTPPLPRTGTAIMSIALSGLAAIAAGAGILLVLRRRRDALLSSSDE